MKRYRGGKEMVNLVQLNCPKCGAVLDVQDGIDSLFCSYCGEKLLIDGQRKELIQAKVRLKEMEHKERLKDRKYSHEERILDQQYDLEAKKLEHKKKKWKIIGAILLFYFVIAPVCVSLAYPSFMKFVSQPNKYDELNDELKELEKEIEQDIADGKYDDALLKCNRMRYVGYDEYEKMWDEKRETYIEYIEKKMSEAENGEIEDEETVDDKEEDKEEKDKENND